VVSDGLAPDRPDALDRPGALDPPGALDRPGALDVLVILDGASEPLTNAPTSLERAHTPTLDGLAASGELVRVRTVAPGIPAGSETAIPALLGWTPDGRVDRGAIEAAAHDVELGAGERAWRVDRRDREDASQSARALAGRLPDHCVHHLAGHRMLVVGGEASGAHLLDTPSAWPMAAELRVWPAGAIPPVVLDADTVVIGARGAAVGIARLMGARTIVPPGATGKPGTNLEAKAAAALRAMDEGAKRVVVHVGSPDEAAHERDREGKIAAIEAADRLLLEPLARALRERAELHLGAVRLRVCPDHGCDPATGEHDDAPVPCVVWPAASGSAGRMTERAVAVAERAVAA
jgi:2,3-bisphosphoglycerate-independent phosphoglycerate mutase